MKMFGKSMKVIGIKDGVDLLEDNTYYLKAVPEDIQKFIKEKEQGITKGSITVPSVR